MSSGKCLRRWTCPKCSREMTATGRTWHLRFCGADIGARFWSFVRKQEGCWPWQGALHRDGYGRFNLPQHGGMVITHRYAWKLTHGEIPDGLHVLHKCDNPPCCNPAHLWLGTRLDNAQDCVKKGRRPTPSPQSQAALKRYREERKAAKLCAISDASPK